MTNPFEAHFPRIYRDQTDLPVYRLGLEGHWCQNGWWNTWGSPLSPDGQHIAFQAVDLERQKIDAVVLDLQGHIVRRFETSQDVHDLNNYHGGGVVWSPDGSHILVDEPGYNCISRSARINAYRLSDGAKIEGASFLPPGVPRIAGSKAIDAIDMGELEKVPAPTDYGVYQVRPDGREVLRVSVQDVLDERRQKHPDFDALPDVPVDCCWEEWDATGRWFFIEFGNHTAHYCAPQKPPIANEMWIGSHDFGTLRPMIPYLAGQNGAPAPQSFLNHGSISYPNPNYATGATPAGVACVALEGGPIEHYHVGQGGGHCSLSPDRKWLVSDTYNTVEGQTNGVTEGYLVLIERATGAVHKPFRFGRKMTQPIEWWRTSGMNHGDGPLTTDGHPNWSLGGKFVTFNAMFGDFSQVCVADVSALVGA